MKSRQYIEKKETQLCHIHVGLTLVCSFTPYLIIGIRLFISDLYINSYLQFLIHLNSNPFFFVSGKKFVPQL